MNFEFPVLMPGEASPAPATRHAATARDVFHAALDEAVAKIKVAETADGLRDALESLNSLVDIGHGAANHLAK